MYTEHLQFIDKISAIQQIFTDNPILIDQINMHIYGEQVVNTFPGSYYYIINIDLIKINVRKMFEESGDDHAYGHLTIYTW